MLVVKTVGHGTLGADELGDVLAGAGTDVLADVRRHPGSRRHPHVGREALASWLPARGVAYRWLPELGGRRGGAAGSTNTALRNAQFRAYADHMATDAFREGVAALLDLARGHALAVLCSESVWWRCHRRLLADHLVLVEGVRVEHVFHDGRVVEHVPLPEARARGGTVTYPSPGDAPVSPN